MIVALLLFRHLFYSSFIFRCLHFRRGTNLSLINLKASHFAERFKTLAEWLLPDSLNPHLSQVEHLGEFLQKRAVSEAVVGIYGLSLPRAS